ncbi:uncharacterized protein LOC112503983 isoform X2 [Cynara cardunculus var. scolymus]|uniref:uncharacterized protein LOC112503983 isoform X2 n=1 Tax=Cynara cardunculus var. scolymus TaxID=59895 RepID=UPI000D6249C2|nr:uncharacterized protein LOC112503983 isoform X2 [Cynara cardunculus var. scolymus]
MASLHILKSGLYPFYASQSSSRRKERLICHDSRRIINFRSKVPINTRFMVSCKVQDADDNESKGEEPTESLFMKELKRRGMTPTSLLEESWSTSKDENRIYKEEDGGFSNRNAVSTDLEKSLSNQRERSMALNSEGLEGLIPRAKVLLTLGGTYFLAFWPLILVTVASFSAVYVYFGPKFVHDASTRQVYLPQYVDPYALLEDQRISETAPRLN